MRIGIDAHLVKVKPTGVGKAITRTIEAMVNAAPQDEFVIYANREFPDILDGKSNCRAVRTRLIARSRALRVLHEFCLMPRRVLRDKIDVFYAPGYVFLGKLPAPMVLGVFDLNALKHPKLVKPETARYYRRALPASARRARLVVAPTRAVADDIETILEIPAERVRVVPCAVDDRFREPPENSDVVAKKYGLDAPYVLFVGNIEPNKNLELLVSAFFAAKMNKGLPHKLVIAGKKRHRAWRLVRAIRQLGCAECVLFTGYVSEADLPALYAGADAFVYPSHAEGFGIPPLEAMTLGRPTITSEDPAVVEVTGDGALHFPASDVAALREAIEKVLTDKAFAEELSRRGLEVAAQYTWARTGRETMAVICEAAGQEP